MGLSKYFSYDKDKSLSRVSKYFSRASVNLDAGPFLLNILVAVWYQLEAFATWPVSLKQEQFWFTKQHSGFVVSGLPCIFNALNNELRAYRDSPMSVNLEAIFINSFSASAVAVNSHQVDINEFLNLEIYFDKGAGLPMLLLVSPPSGV